ncbi:hypothetical protein [Streptomyces sp. NPDC048639]|uniref:hypothetical protein n=1 Tax=Streptomyces sp. NPDC048639 TaxID=3365581 RepID=UPI0037249DD8
MERPSESAGAAGCLVAAAGAAAGFFTWLRIARPGLSGAFEGERDWSLLHVELPALVFGFPAAALAAWGLVHLALRGRAPRSVRALAGVLVVLVTLALLWWICVPWLDTKSDTPL